MDGEYLLEGLALGGLEREREHVSVTRRTGVRAQRRGDVQGREPARPGLCFLMEPA